MKFRHVVGASLLASCVSGSAGAGGPGVPGILDRPTPPACCADGICYPNPTTWGAYPTRWRRWPGEVLAPTPADAAAPLRPGGELPVIERPGPEDEDRQAPRPTPTPEAAETETDGEIRRPPATPPTTSPTTPPLTPPLDTPGTPPLTPPIDLDTTPGTPFEDDQPGDMESTLPFHSQLRPQGDDPPPSPPFRAAKVAEAPRQQQAAPAKFVPAPAPAPRAAAPAPSSDSDDPPPAFPLTLG